MRTTIRMDEDLLRQAKSQAASTGISLTALIEQAVREKLQSVNNRPRPKIDLPVYHCGGPMPGVDLNNNAALFDLLDEEDATYRH